MITTSTVSRHAALYPILGAACLALSDYLSTTPSDGAAHDALEAISRLFGDGEAPDFWREMHRHIEVLDRLDQRRIDATANGEAVDDALSRLANAANDLEAEAAMGAKMAAGNVLQIAERLHGGIVRLEAIVSSDRPKLRVVEVDDPTIPY